ncbi:hypothetical protein [Amycolatopsis magusensis]|uniref:hypothetical protein n=1 Tax=Amycolatopsis magusensis TaxID=882444 RepID=UPI0024A97D10|nr:hypothetical protein [Amycolatopsis magusensis]MDI5976915.1 hypothetical protein [Amycolatopsis magusensis]
MSEWSDLHDKGVQLVADGDLAGARATLETAVATAAVADRAQALLNLAHVVDLAGERQHAVDLMTEALTVAEQPLRALIVAARATLLPWLDRWDEAWSEVAAELEEAGLPQQVALRHSRSGLLMMAGRLDEAKAEAVAALESAESHAPEYLGPLHADLASTLLARAWEHHAETRLPEALAELNEAAVHAAHLGEEAKPFTGTIAALRARVLVTGGSYAEAADAAQVALEHAHLIEPSMVASVHSTLAEITSGTGDLAGAVEHLALARELSAMTGDTEGEFTAVLSTARLAYLAADAERAEALYGEAESLVADEPRRLAMCLHGRAAVAVLTGRAREALALVDRSLALFGESATPLELVAVHQVRGSVFEALGEFADAESCYAEAAAHCEAAGWWHVALGMAWWRTDALVRRAAAVTGAERRAISLRALDLGLPAALAAEAVRQRFPHGPLRERWVALAAAPATRSALLAIRAVEDPSLAVEYLDHLAGAVSLHAETTVAREELVSLPEPPAAGGFELPPRVRADPAAPSGLDRWIDLTEQRYGFPVRSGGAVASW